MKAEVETVEFEIGNANKLFSPASMGLLIWLVSEPLGLEENLNTSSDLKDLKGILRLLPRIQNWIINQKNAHSK